VSSYLSSKVNHPDKMAGFALRDAAGKPLILDRIPGPKLVNFWATWCGPCVEEFPILSEAAQDADVPFSVVFVNVWDDQSAFVDFAADQPHALHLVVDEEDEVNQGIGVVAIPTTMLIDADGIVRAVHVGNVTPTVMAFLQAVTAGLD